MMPRGAQSGRTLLFTLQNKTGALRQVLQYMSNHNINLSHIESRPARFSKEEYEFVVDVASEQGGSHEQNLQNVMQSLVDNGIVTTVQYLGGAKIPWFPRRIRDIDHFSKKHLAAGGELEADHPGFKDKEYVKRREEIAQIARDYRHGQPIPKINYTKNEIETWGEVFDRLVSLFPTHACQEMNHIFPLLKENCGYSRDNIPQLEDVSQFLQDTTGFRLRPVTGLLTSRDFLAGLAFRVFHSTQYIRHHSKPLYTPEPDIIHELMGHAPLFADPAFADFSQEIGLASLGQNDEDVLKLATLYWFTVEFGVCKQGGEMKAYGAGLLSSFGELEHCISGKSAFKPLDPPKTSTTEYPITTYQPTYFVADSFEKAKNQVSDFAATQLCRPFAVRYDPLTLSVDILNDRKKLVNQVKRIGTEVNILKAALDTIDDLDGNSLLQFETTNTPKEQP